MKNHTPGELEQQVLLAVWQLGEDAYGLTVRDELLARAGRGLTVGAVYATLVRLERKGWVSSRLAEPTPVRGGKRKRFFAVTPEGVQVVQGARVVMERLWEGLDPEAEEATG